MEEKRLNPVVASYEKYPEDRRLSADNSRRLEFLTGLAYMDKYIKPGDMVLDVAAGTGAYALHYASKGVKMTALDITPVYINLLREKAEAAGVELPSDVNDARDLSRFEDGHFDCVLCMGPIYHLIEEEDRKRVLEECKRVLKPGGLLYIAYINKLFVFYHLALSSRQYRQESFFKKIIEEQVIRDEEKDCFWTDAWFTTPEEIEAMAKDLGFEKVAHVAQDGVGRLRSEDVDSMSAEEFAHWTEFHLKTCEEPSILGISNHGLYIGRKQ